MSCSVRSIAPRVYARPVRVNPSSRQRLRYAPPPGAPDKHQVIVAGRAALARSRLEHAPRSLARGLGLGRGGEGFDRMRQQVTLHAERPALREELELRGALHALGDHLQPETM